MMISNIITYFIIIVFIIITYENSLSNDFAFDDNHAIINNNDVVSNSDYYSILKHDIWGKDLLAVDSHRSYRPLLVMLFKVLYQYYGLSSKAFRIVSILLHAISSCLVYHLILVIYNDSNIAIGSSLLFATHPIHVEAVSCVVNMAEALHCIFYIVAYLIFWKSVTTTTDTTTDTDTVTTDTDTDTNNKDLNTQMNDNNYKYDNVSVSAIQNNKNTTKDSNKLYLFTWPLVVSIASLCKETGITVCGLVVYKVIIDVLSTLSNTKRGSILMYRQIYWTVLAFFSVTIYFVFRALLVNGDAYVMAYKLISFDFISLISSIQKSYLGESQLIRKAENPFAFLNGMEKVLSLFYLHFRYFLCLVWPVNLSPEYSFDCIPKVSTIFDFRNIYSTLMYGTLVNFVVFKLYTMLCNKGKGNETASMIALSWLIVPFIPASGVLLRLGTLLAERLLYIPSIGYCMIFASIISQFCQRIEKWIGKRQNMKHVSFYFIISIICANYISLARSYNSAWKNDAALFEYAITVCPRSAKLNLQLGKLYLNNGNYSIADNYVQMAKQIDPEFCDVGYQEALLKIFYENNIDDSIELAANNLNCIFTSRQSVELLNKLWELQLQGATENKYEILASQALLAFNSGLSLVGLQKYMTAANIAIESGNHNAYISMTKKVEKIISKVITISSLEESIIFFDAKCTQAGHTGTVFFYLGNDDNKIKLSKSNKKYILKNVRKKLFKGATLPCLTNALNDDGTENTGNNAIIAMHKLAEHLTIAYNNLTFATPYNKFSTDISDLVKFTETLASFYSESLKKYIKYSGAINDTNVIEYNEKIRKQYEQIAVLNIQLGKRQFNEGLYVEADKTFQKVQIYEGVYDCVTLYWHVHSIASFYNHSNDVALLKRILKLLNENSKCSDDNIDPNTYTNGFSEEHRTKLNDFKKLVAKNL